MRLRKLIGKLELDAIVAKLQVGVPLARIIREAELDISQPAAVKVVNWYANANSPIVYNSLFPEWLPADSKVTEQPEGWSYEGYFPLGKWVQV